MRSGGGDQSTLGKGQSTRLRRAVDSLTDELVALWAPQFEPRSWSERLQLLNEMHEQLQDDIGNLEIYSSVSPTFIQKLIERLSGGPVSSAAQAHIYANSGNQEHRRSAGEWLNRQKRARD